MTFFGFLIGAIVTGADELEVIKRFRRSEASFDESFALFPGIRVEALDEGKAFGLFGFVEDKRLIEIEGGLKRGARFDEMDRSIGLSAFKTASGARFGIISAMDAGDFASAILLNADGADEISVHQADFFA